MKMQNAAATNPTLLRQRSGTQTSADGIFGAPRIQSSDKNAFEKSARALEETFVKSLLEASGAFELDSGDDNSGASFTKDAFLSAIAGAVSNSGTGLGIANLMQPPSNQSPSPQAHPHRTNEVMLPTLSSSKDTNNVTTDLAALLVGGKGRKTSSFGFRHDPFTGAIRAHRGVDIGAKEGTPVSAAQTGRVIFAGDRGGYGNAVEIQSEDGTRTLYAHLSAIAVKKGDAITAGARIGAVGKTGRATGSHLHVEVRRGRTRLDPEQVLKRIQKRVERLHEHQGSFAPAPAPALKSNGGAS